MPKLISHTPARAKSMGDERLSGSVKGHARGWRMVKVKDYRQV
jgi:hypothetical protein